MQNLGPRAPVRGQVQKLEGLLRQIISAKALQCQDEIFDIAAIIQILYNYYINRRYRLMATNEFFTAYQYAAFDEFVDAELREMFQCTNPQDENFDLDVPF